ncbi:MAG: hypothetical protein ACOC0P_01155 [Planctomycetota bacterium]
MRPVLVNVLSTVQLSRLTNAFAGVANLWFVVLWTRANALEAHHEQFSGFADSPLDVRLMILLGLATILGLGIPAYAGALNDIFDVRRDQALAPGRPIPSGRISVQTAAAIGFGFLILSVLASAGLGVVLESHLPLLVCLGVAMLILLFNTMFKFIPGLAFTALAAIYAMHMLIMNPGMRFIWPMLLIMVHVVAVYSAAYALEKRSPQVRWTSIVGTVLGLGGIGLLLWFQTGSEGVMRVEEISWFGLAWPIAAVVVFVLSVVNKARYASSRVFAAEKLQRYGALWLGFYGLAWLLAAGLWVESLILAIPVTMGVLGMLIVRDLGAWIEQPVAYRW